MKVSEDAPIQPNKRRSEVRWELDRLLLSKVLGFREDTHPEVHEGVRILRERLCAEPSIHGGKKEKGCFIN